MYTYAYNGSDRISVLKNISIYDLLRFYKYCILVFDFIRSIMDIQIFRFESKHITNQIKYLRIFCPSYP